jgi:hypothetical protein
MSQCERSDCNPATCPHSSHRKAHVHVFDMAGFCRCILDIPTWNDDDTESEGND